VRVSVGDVRLYFEVFGQEWTLADDTMQRRPTVIGLHGGPGLDGTRLRYQLAQLAELAQVVVPDQRGHGRSDRGTAETWNLATWAADVKNLCDALSIEHPVVLGNSFGGFVAQQFAATYPEHPAGLILLSTGPRWASLEEAVARFREAGGEEAAEVVRRAMESPSEQTAAEWRRVLGPLASLNPHPDPTIAQLEAERIETLDVNAHFAREGRVMDLRDRLGAVRCPTLVVLGEADLTVPTHLGREIVEAVPDGLARLELVPEAAHDVLIDQPAETYRLIREFLADLACRQLASRTAGHSTPSPLAGPET
jgi:proline-specific peptidase